LRPFVNPEADWFAGEPGNPQGSYSSDGRSGIATQHP
jgi:hypothetical protein